MRAYYRGPSRGTNYRSATLSPEALAYVRRVVACHGYYGAAKVLGMQDSTVMKLASLGQASRPVVEKVESQLKGSS